MLRPLLFVNFIDDIDENVCSTILKFTVETRLDMLNLFKWSKDWQMMFNLDKLTRLCN